MKKKKTKKGKFKLIALSFFLISFLLLFAPANAEPSKIYVIPINYDKGAISFGEITTKMGYVPPQDNNLVADKSQQYSIELVSFAGAVLERKNFSFALTILPATPLPGAETMGLPATLDKTTELVIFPYHKDGRELKVYDGNKKLIISKDIAYLSDVCGDKVCQDHESNESCPKDCQAAAKDDYCNPQYRAADPDCASAPAGQTAAESKNNAKIYIFVVSIIAVILLSVFAFIWARRRDSGIG